MLVRVRRRRWHSEQRIRAGILLSQREQIWPIYSRSLCLLDLCLPEFRILQEGQISQAAGLLVPGLFAKLVSGTCGANKGGNIPARAEDYTSSCLPFEPQGPVSLEQPGYCLPHEMAFFGTLRQSPGFPVPDKVNSSSPAPVLVCTRVCISDARVGEESELEETSGLDIVSNTSSFKFAFPLSSRPERVETVAKLDN
ncbi:hypothetical protein PoB_006635000 [Plakobranchus ocellatus]|uniref:Uncharacterized protein n=1 Tax=Plakobranchus ocellatus TaxID=259542 RepID=A0AAV4D703_9GAST|nr:hypothetical protein PoB_006635000 [Plakobranchus ocellatus]